MTMLDLAKELNRPRQEAGWVVKVAIGALFSLAMEQWFLWPLTFFATGYLYRVFSNNFTQAQELPLPDWMEWKELFVNGLIVFLIVAGYVILPEFCYLVSKSVFEGGSLAKLVAMAFFAGTALLFVAAFFFIPMGIAQYARHKKISSAFVIREIWDRIMNVGDDYFKVTLLSIISIVLFAVLRDIIPYLGPILAVLAGFYISLVLATLFGQVCRESYGEVMQQPATEPAEENPSD
jgi:hypothetical protein